MSDVKVSSDDAFIAEQPLKEKESSDIKTNSNNCMNSQKERKDKLLYGIDDVPPWYLCMFLGFQHYLTMFGSTVAVPLLLASPLGIENNDVAKGQIISTVFFASGISTLLQTAFGNRLPIVQGAAFSFLAPAIAILTSIPLPDDSISGNNTNGSGAGVDLNEFWKTRMVQIQGAIMVASVTQVLLGLTGLIGFLMSHIGPLTIAPTITLVGLGLFNAAGTFAGKHWGISFLTMFLIILFSQYLRDVEVPIPSLNKNRTVYKVKIFSLFPIIYAILLAWSFSALLTAVGGFPSNSSLYGYEARTDIRLGVLSESPWFRIPYPGQWGLPIVTVSGVLGMISGVLASIIESIGDYYACARLCYVPAPPTHAINRGIVMEGIGCLIAGAIGTGNGTTSYSENIGAIGITKVGSRRVVQTGAVIMLLLAIIGKFGALFTTIPDPVVGGMFCVMFGMITAVGISSLQFVDLNSSRNLLILGFSIFIGITLPEWTSKNEDLISIDVPEVNQVVLVLLKTGMFQAGLLAFILDNTVPGTPEERGLIKWRDQNKNTTGQDKNASTAVYNLPNCMQRGLENVDVFRYLPICPSFQKPKANNNSVGSYKVQQLEMSPDKQSVEEMV